MGSLPIRLEAELLVAVSRSERDVGGGELCAEAGEGPFGVAAPHLEEHVGLVLGWVDEWVIGEIAAHLDGRVGVGERRPRRGSTRLATV